MSQSRPLVARRPTPLRFALLTTLCLSSAAQAATPVNGTELYYSNEQDPITDINKGAIWIYEQYDTYGDTRFTMRCDNKGQPDFWSYITNKNDLLTDEQLRDMRWPAVTVRLGEDSAFGLPNNNLVSVSDRKDRLNTRSIGFDAATTRTIVRGLRAGKRLAVRVKRSDGGQPLTFIFPAAGFNEGWQGVRACDNTGVPGGNARSSSAGSSSAGSSSAGSSSAGGNLPKVKQWYFGPCRDQNGVPATGLRAGSEQRCELIVELLSAAKPWAADFRYELEYREGNHAGKLKLDGVDHYTSAGDGNVTMRQDGNRLIFGLPLNVRRRVGRIYTSINVIGDLSFAGGVKHIYEPLPVR